MISAFLITVIVIAMLAGISWIPAFKVGNVTLKKINIFSDILHEEEDTVMSPPADAYFDTTFLAEGEALRNLQLAQEVSPVIPKKSIVSESWTLAENDVEPSQKQPVASIEEDKIVAVEDFGKSAGNMDRFYAALAGKQKSGRPIRIGVLGDSFIEGDIFTADIREQMQNQFGGNGVGFIPFASPVAKFRGTVKHSFDKWKVIGIRDSKAKKKGYEDRFFVSGLVCVPEEGATVRLQGVTFRKHIRQASVAKLLFVNRKNTNILVSINDSVSKIFTPDTDSVAVQQIVIRGAIKSIAVTFTHTEGFIGYGIALEDEQGVNVDNFSIRGNSGLGLFETNSLTNSQVGRMNGYDLLVLQYGLNVMSPEVLNYDAYAQKFVQIINYISHCFPESSILVMGVGDRSSMRDGQFVTMPAVKGMIRAQRGAAQEAGVAFWDTFQGMGGENSMVHFVEKNWAAKDYTHIGYPGGRYIATQFTQALIRGMQQRQAKLDAVKPTEIPIPLSLPETTMRVEPIK